MKYTILALLILSSCSPKKQVLIPNSVFKSKKTLCNELGSTLGYHSGILPNGNCLLVDSAKEKFQYIPSGAIIWISVGVNLRRNLAVSDIFSTCLQHFKLDSDTDSEEFREANLLCSKLTGRYTLYKDL